MQYFTSLCCLPPKFILALNIWLLPIFSSDLNVIVDVSIDGGLLLSQSLDSKTFSSKDKLPLVGPFETFSVQSSSLQRHKRSRLLWTECTNCYDSNKAELKLDKSDKINHAAWTISVKLHEKNEFMPPQNKSFHQSPSRLETNFTSENAFSTSEQTQFQFESTPLTDQLGLIFSPNSILIIIFLTAVLLSIINIFLLLRRKLRRVKHELPPCPSEVKIATQAMIVIENEVEPQIPITVANSMPVENSDIITPLRINRRQVQPSSQGSSYEERNIYSCHSISTRYSTPGYYQHGRSGSNSPSEQHDASYLPIAAVSINSRSPLQERSRSRYDVDISPYQSNRNHSLDEVSFTNNCTQANLQLLPVRSYPYPSLLSAEFASPMDKNKVVLSSPHSSPSNDDIGELSDIYDCLDVVDDDSQDAIVGTNRADSVNSHLDLSHLYGDGDDDEANEEAALGHDCGYAADEHGFAFVDDNPALTLSLHSPVFRNSRNNSNNCSMISNDGSRYVTPRSRKSTSADRKYDVSNRLYSSRQNSDYSNDVVLDDCDKTSNEDDGCSSGRHSENGDNAASIGAIGDPSTQHSPDNEYHGIVAEIEQCVIRLKANENEPLTCVNLNTSSAFEGTDDFVMKPNRTSIANFLDCSRILLINNEIASMNALSLTSAPETLSSRNDDVRSNASPQRLQCNATHKNYSHTINSNYYDEESDAKFNLDNDSVNVNVKILLDEEQVSPLERLKELLCTTVMDQNGTELDVLVPLNADTVDLAAPVYKLDHDISGGSMSISCKSLEYMTIEKHFLELNDNLDEDIFPVEESQCETICFDPLTIS